MSKYTWWKPSSIWGTRASAIVSAVPAGPRKSGRPLCSAIACAARSASSTVSRMTGDPPCSVRSISDWSRPDFLAPATEHLRPCAGRARGRRPCSRRRRSGRRSRASSARRSRRSGSGAVAESAAGRCERGSPGRSGRARSSPRRGACRASARPPRRTSRAARRGSCRTGIRTPCARSRTRRRRCRDRRDRPRCGRVSWPSWRRGPGCGRCWRRPSAPA